MIRVRVPATTANLGPGFDSFGLALSLYAEITFGELPEGSASRFSGIDAPYCNDENLAVRAYNLTLSALGISPKPLFLSINSDVPIARGLGSSASLIVAGVVAANAQHGCKLSPKQLLAIATSIEGHPDNVAPALFGGLTVSIMTGIAADPGTCHPLSSSCPVSPEWKFCVLIPDFELSTKKARGVLPKEVPFSSAVFNTSRSAMLLRALETGDPELLSASLDDRLHQPFRKALIPGYEELEKLALACGAAGFCISGAGPTLLAVFQAPEFPARLEAAVPGLKLQSKWRILALGVDRSGAQWEQTE